LYNNPKRRKSYVDSDQLSISIAKSNIYAKKVLMRKAKSSDLICTSNIIANIRICAILKTFHLYRFEKQIEKRKQ